MDLHVTATSEGMVVLTEITLEPNAESVGEARRRIDRALASADVCPEQCERVVLASSELLTNAVLHGSVNRVLIEVRLDGDEVELRVAQQADGAGVPDVAAWQLPEQSGQIGGRGLAIVALIADHVELRVDGHWTEIRAWFVPRSNQQTDARD